MFGWNLPVETELAVASAFVDVAELVDAVEFVAVPEPVVVFAIAVEPVAAFESADGY